MKKLLLLLLFPLALHAQEDGLGEYQSFRINPTDHAVYTMRTGVQVKVPGQPANIVNCFGGLHVHYFVDINGNAYAYDENTGTWTLVDTKVAKVAPSPSGTGAAIIHADGSLWAQGVQQKFPAGTVITDVWYNNEVLSLDSAGNVYRGTTKVSLPGPAKAIAAHQWAAHIVLRNGQILAYGPDYRYYGYALNQLSSAASSPIRVDQLYKLPAPITQISANYMTTYAILTDGSIWAWGENTSGTVGNGQETNMLATNPTYSAPWYNTPQWNLPASQGGALFQILPVQIGKGIQWAHLGRGTCYAMYMIAKDVNGHSYSWGRWKGLDLWNGVTGTTAQFNNQANQPNLFDVLIPTPIKDFATVTPPPPPANKPPVARIFNPDAKGMQYPGDTVMLYGDGSSDPDGTIVSYSYKQIGGPPSILVQSGANAMVFVTAVGDYTYQLTVTDDKGATGSDTGGAVIFRFPACPAPVVCPVCPPIPAPRTVTGVSINTGGQIVPLTQLLPFLLFTYSN